MLFQNGDLIESRGIENNIGVFLIRKDPPLLPGSDAVPHGQGMLHRSPPGFVVPDDPPQKPQIAGGDPVVVIQIQRQQRTDIHPENQIAVYILRQHGRIQTVQALHNDHGIRCQTHMLSPPLPSAGKEVEGGQLYLFSPQQGSHILAEQRTIQCIDMFQIQFSIRAGRNLIPVNVIVIQAHKNGLFPMNTKLGCQTMSRCGFSGGAGPCQHHNPGPPLTGHICHLGIALFMQGFIHPDQFPDPAGLHHVVEVSHSFAFHQRTPVLALGKHTEKVRHRRHISQFFRVLIVRVDKNKAILCRDHIPYRQKTGRGHHLTIVVVRKISIAVFVKIVCLPPGQQSCLIRLSVRFIPLHGLCQRYPAADQRNVLGNQLGYMFLQPLRGKIRNARHFNIQAGTQGAARFGRGFWPKLAYGQENHKPGCSQIAFLTCLVSITQQTHLSIGGCHGSADGGTLRIPITLTDRNVIQGKHLTGNFCRQRSAGQLRCIQPQLLDQFQQTGTGHCLDLSSVNLQLHCDTSQSVFPYGIIAL